MTNFLQKRLSRKSWIHGLFKETDNGPLVIFRVIFGFLIFYHATTFIIKGFVNEYFIRPTYIFTFIGFEFLQVFHGNGMYYYFGLLAVSGLMIMTGSFYRTAVILFCLLWQILYLIQKVNYNNHYYLMLLIGYILIFVPANSYFSMDVLRRPGIKKTTCPQWVYFLFVAQVTLLYSYSGLNKLNDSWLSGSFYESVYFFKKPLPLVGSLYGYSWFKTLIVWGGLLFDLLICPLLLWKKSRNIAFLAACCFHLFNSYIFSIKIFPYLCIGLFLFFLDPVKVSNFFFRNRQRAPAPFPENKQGKLAWRVVYILVAYLLVQVALPLRPYLFTGNTNWTEEGYRMSWRMMVRNKTGNIHFTAMDSATGKVWKNLEHKLTKNQLRTVATRPDIIWQYAQYLKADFAKIGYDKIKIYASASVVLNNYAPRPIVDSTLDLAKIKWYPFQHSSWIVPFGDSR